jgi:hypothetical protein
MQFIPEEKKTGVDVHALQPENIRKTSRQALFFLWQVNLF